MVVMAVVALTRNRVSESRGVSKQGLCMAGRFQAAWSLEGMRQVTANAERHGVSQPVREEEGFYAVGDSGGLGDLEEGISTGE